MLCYILHELDIRILDNATIVVTECSAPLNISGHRGHQWRIIGQHTL